MRQRINEYEFREAFERVGRGEQFSYEALGLLFEYLNDLEEETGTPYDLDVIAICCEFAEDTVEDIAENYGIDLSSAEDDEDRRETVRDYLEEYTYIVGETDDGFVYQLF